MFRITILLLLAFSLFYFSGCGKKNENPQDQNTEKSADNDDDQKTGFKKLDDFVDNMKQMKKDMEAGKEVEVVDFRDLKAILPETIGNLNRTSTSGEKTNSMGINISKAEGKYGNEPKEGEESKSVEIEITDLGNIKGWAGLAMWGWTFADIDKETDDGYEKTFKSGNNKGFESYTNSSQSGKVEMLVAERFMVKVEGYNVPMETIKDALNNIGVGRLEAMKDKGVTYKEDKKE